MSKQFTLQTTLLVRNYSNCAVGPFSSENEAIDQWHGRRWEETFVYLSGYTTLTMWLLWHYWANRT